jgi:hypothetical protein
MIEDRKSSLWCVPSSIIIFISLYSNLQDEQHLLLHGLRNESREVTQPIKNTLSLPAAFLALMVDTLSLTVQIQFKCHIFSDCSSQVIPPPPWAWQSLWHYCFTPIIAFPTSDNFLWVLKESEVCSSYLFIPATLCIIGRSWMMDIQTDILVCKAEEVVWGVSEQLSQLTSTGWSGNVFFWINSGDQLLMWIWTPFGL